MSSGPGFLALRQIADFFNISHDPDPHFPASPISITRQEFDKRRCGNWRRAACLSSRTVIKPGKTLAAGV